MQTLKILLDLAEQQNELATDFLNDAQKSSGKSENDFWKALCSGWQYFADKLNGNAGEHTNSIINMPFAAEQFALVFYFAGKKNKEIYTKDGLTKEGLRIIFKYLIYYAEEHRLNWYYYPYNGKPFAISYEASPIKIYELYKVLSEQDFKRELKKKKPEQIAEFLDIHLKEFVRGGGQKADWVRHTKQFISLLSIEQRDSFYNWVEENHIELPSQQSEPEKEQETENNFTLSTIEDWLFQFKESMIESDYKNLVSALKEYFDNGKFPTLAKPIQINGRPNKKLFGWHLNRIFEAKGKGVEKELLQFAKHNISLFKNVAFDENNILKSNLYKYFTTKTK
jgi:hypothetical protein